MPEITTDTDRLLAEYNLLQEETLDPITTADSGQVNDGVGFFEKQWSRVSTTFTDPEEQLSNFLLLTSRFSLLLVLGPAVSLLVSHGRHRCNSHSFLYLRSVACVLLGAYVRAFRL